MKKVSMFLAAMVLAAVTAFASPQNPCNPCSKKAQNPCNPCAKKADNPCNPCAKKAQNPCNPCSDKSAKVKGGNRTIVGYVGDSQCGLEHPMEMGDAQACALKCVEGGGHFVLADRDNKVVYSLDKKGEAKAREFAGRKVKITGNVDARTKTIKVSKIEAAS